jgi:hypothetical protein
MGWTGRTELKHQVQKLWDGGALLAELAGAPSRLPLKLRLKTPTSTEMTSRFDEVRTWATEIRKMPHIRFVEREFNHKVLGRNALPAEAWVDCLASASAILDKKRECRIFQTIVDTTRATHPELTNWLQENPLKALALADSWVQLLSIVSWMKVNPKPNIYMRQIDLPGIHTKFVENHQSILSALLDISLDAHYIDDGAPAGRFEQRYGFKTKPTMVRFRILDPDLRLWEAYDCDNALEQRTFSTWKCDARNIYITENEINYLAFPSLTSSIVIFGKGIGIHKLLEDSPWLQHKKVFYWGDIDTHGFSILNQARRALPSIQSLLMDIETMNNHMHMLVEEPTALANPTFHHLTKEELELCQSLKGLSIFNNARLEQERIAWRFATERIMKTVSDSSNQ